MKTGERNREQLLKFYFGAISEKERFALERQLLIDQETLLDFLDLKREIEAAAMIPQEPSPVLWQRLKQSVRPRKRLVISLSLGALVAACLVMAILLTTQSGQDNERVAYEEDSRSAGTAQTAHGSLGSHSSLGSRGEQDRHTEFLFDATAELSSSSGVM